VKRQIQQLDRITFLELPVEIQQHTMDLLPFFRDRARLCRVATAALRLQWRLAPPLRVEEELSGMNLGDKGACAVALALTESTNSALGELCLGSNNIGDTGAQALAAVLGGRGAVLRRLSLRDNKIGDVGAVALVDVLRTNTMLEELDLWGNCLSDESKHKLRSETRCDVFLELDPAPCPYMTTVQTGINAKMRAILFDWISQVHTGVNSPATPDGAMDPQDMLFRTFSHVDAYLSVQAVQRAELQLAGVACTLSAAGLNANSQMEDDADLASWLAFVTDGACTAAEVRAMVCQVHETLRFRLYQPTVYNFLRRYLRRTGWTEESFSLANYLIELAATDSSFLKHRKQATAAAAAVLSRQYLSQGIAVRHISHWKAKLLRCAHVDLRSELAPCCAAMAQLHASENGRPKRFVSAKYTWARLHMVAKIPPNPPADAAFFVQYLSAEDSA
jgi:hypothetical protein